MPKRAALRKPKSDDRRLWDVFLGIWGYPAVLVAHELKFFELLADKPLALDEICKAKQLAPRPAHAILAVCTSMGLLALRGGRYSLTPVAREYLLPSSPFYFGLDWYGFRPGLSICDPDSPRQAVVNGKPPGGVRDPG